MLNRQKIVGRTLVVLYFLLLSYDGVQGKKRLSKLEDQTLEKKLKFLNKPAITTIKTKWGDTYDCVDFYKQPSFDHPLLKNHNFHLEMKPNLSTITQNPNNSSLDISLRIWLNNKGCPSGTVPIKRLTKDDLIRQKRMPPQEDMKNNNNSEPKRKYKSSQGYKLAIVHTSNDPNNKFAGAGMSASIWKPHVKGRQHSACRLKVQKGMDIIQVGWRVDPTLYGDTKTRFFTHFQAASKHCFNTLCPGFILVTTEIPLDMAFIHITQPGDKRPSEFKMYIDQDIANGNWWLLLGNNHTQVGFWPQRIFTALAKFANNIEWGGVAYSPRGVPEPPIGSGEFPVIHSSYDAYCSGLVIINDKGETIDAEKTPIFLDDLKLYRVIDQPYWGVQKFPHFVFYGGGGGIYT